ncbi:MAG: hypothetical protein ACK5CA_08770, partial [Cyanobacteriota bacterium]
SAVENRERTSSVAASLRLSQWTAIRPSLVRKPSFKITLCKSEMLPQDHCIQPLKSFAQLSIAPHDGMTEHKSQAHRLVCYEN